MAGEQIKMDKKNLMKYSKITLIAVVVISLILLISTSRFFMPAEEQVLAPPLKEPDPVVYETFEVSRDTIVDKISARGYFQAETEVDISFKNREGYLKKLYVSNGEQVRQGQLLALLDTESLNEELAQKKLETQGAELSLSRLRDISEMDLEIAELELEELDQNYKLSLTMEESIARKDLLDAERELQKTQISLSRLQLEYSYQISEAERELELAKMEQQQLERDLTRSGIYSPLSGNATYVAFINEGEFVPAYKTVISVADSRSLVLEYHGPEHTRFHLDMPVQVEYDDQLYEGKVILTPRQVPADLYEQMQDVIRIRVEGLPEGCSPGDSASIEARLDWAEGVLVLPKRLVHKYSGRWFVKVLKDGLVSERDVSIGIESPTEYEITQGLEPGELVVE